MADEEKKPRGLTISARQRRLIDEALAIEQENAREAGTIGYAAQVWAQLALPYRDPGPIPSWVRRNGDLTLVIRPALMSDLDGTALTGYPFGVLPRYLMTWMATEAVRTQSPQLDLGPSFNSFLEKLGLSKGGHDGRRLKGQMLRLIGSTMQVQKLTREGEGTRVQGENFNIAESFDLWIPDRDDAPLDQGALWNNTITLSAQFFERIVGGPVPIDLRAMRALAGSPMKLDVYTWLTYRMSYMSKPTVVPWESLAAQFGAQFKRPRDFRAAFVECLNEVTVLYPAARVDVTTAGLKLYPSAPHVARRGRPAIER